MATGLLLYLRPQWGAPGAGPETCGDLVEVTVDPDATVADLKEAYSACGGPASSRVRLRFQDRELEDPSEMLADVGVSAECVVDVCCLAPGRRCIALSCTAAYAVLDCGDILYWPYLCCGFWFVYSFGAGQWKRYNAAAGPPDWGVAPAEVGVQLGHLLAGHSTAFTGAGRGRVAIGIHAANDPIALLDDHTLCGSGVTLDVVTALDGRQVVDIDCEASSASFVDAGPYAHSAALADGSVCTWSIRGGRVQVRTPDSHFAGRRAVSVASGDHFCAALLDDGVAARWGCDPTDNSEWQELNDTLGGNKVIGIAAGGHLWCAVLECGAVVVRARASTDDIPVPDFGERRATAVSATGRHLLALFNDGAVAVWEAEPAGDTSVFRREDGRPQPLMFSASFFGTGRRVLHAVLGGSPATGIEAMALLDDASLARWLPYAQPGLPNSRPHTVAVRVAVGC
eukprot:TRINITY_DN14966_c0_g2_i1.p1 TRINITY_DN14966_c0_g2~~TRINITY_DN14966_c0_g2_i1.p1  ORF type:complete len:480 (+),score=65.53 TRINITY_DN14966_c0_g2_i1:77-1441(+)